MTLDALDAGKHVYVEKPMTHSIKEAQEVLRK
jgi:predicted dehydrogenase